MRHASAPYAWTFVLKTLHTGTLDGYQADPRARFVFHLSVRSGPGQQQWNRRQAAAVADLLWLDISNGAATNLNEIRSTEVWCAGQHMGLWKNNAVLQSVLREMTGFHSGAEARGGKAAASARYVVLPARVLRLMTVTLGVDTSQDFIRDLTTADAKFTQQQRRASSSGRTSTGSQASSAASGGSSRHPFSSAAPAQQQRHSASRAVQQPAQSAAAGSRNVSAGGGAMQASVQTTGTRLPVRLEAERLPAIADRRQRMMVATLAEQQPQQPLGGPQAEEWGLDGLSGQEASVGFIQQLIVEGKNVALIGRAGSGKSTFINTDLLNALAARYGQQWHKHVLITSSTGISAVHIGGVTFHAGLGIGIAAGSVQQICTDMPGPAELRWKGPAPDRRITIIVDEIGCLDGTAFQKAMEAGAIKRGGSLDGVQVIVSGDFLQLGPVPGMEHSGNDGEMPSEEQVHRGAPVLAFQTGAWRELDLNMVLMVGSQRQTGDEAFLNALDKLSVGKVDASVEALLRPCIVDAGYQDDTATSLFGTREAAKKHNTDMLNKLPGPTILSTAGTTSHP